MNFAKAFDTIKHKALWTALAHFGIEPQHINFLKRLYADEKATVLTDKESDVFEVACCSTRFWRLHWKTTWHDGARKAWSSVWVISRLIDSRTCGSRTTCYFLFSTSLEQLRSVMCDFKKSTESVGLKIHPDKTKILSNQGSNRREEVTIDNIKVDVLSMKERAKYLGRTIIFEQQETTEIKSRIRSTWASFTKYGQESTSKSSLLLHRLHLFNMVITLILTKWLWNMDPLD